MELPERLIHLYTYRDDLVLDPFMGSGTTAVAAVRTERHYVGYDTDPQYVEKAKKRVEREKARLMRLRESDEEPPRVVLPSTPAAAPDGEDFQARAVREGRAARDLAREALEKCGFVKIEPNVNLSAGVEVNFVAYDQSGKKWYFDVSGGFTSNRPGLRRTDTLWKALGKAAVIQQTEKACRLVLLTTNAPAPGSAGDAALEAMQGPRKPIRDVVVLSSSDDLQRLRGHARGQAGRRAT